MEPLWAKVAAAGEAADELEFVELEEPPPSAAAVAAVAVWRSNASQSSGRAHSVAASKPAPPSPLQPAFTARQQPTAESSCCAGEELASPLPLALAEELFAARAAAVSVVA